MKLINADTLKEKAFTWEAYEYATEDVDVVFVEDIDNVPTIEYVKHGRWVYYDDETIEDGGRCSVCQCDQPVFLEDWKWKYVETDYCPNCGARMDGDA